MITDFSVLQARLGKVAPKTLVVSAAHDPHTLEAVFTAAESMPMNYILVGDRRKITGISAELGITVTKDQIYHTESDEESAYTAVKLIRDGRGDVLMKGILDTGTLMKAVLNKQTGVRSGSTMSHCAMLEIPAYHKLIAITDGGMLTYPSIEEKADIVRNAVRLFQNLGQPLPKIAAIAASESISDKMPETRDAAVLRQIIADGQNDCILEGPLSFDIAVSKDSAAIKGVESAVAGDIDILLVPNIATGNVLCKSLLYWAGAKMAGCVLGAKVPIVLVSRGATAEEKLLSILLCLSGASTAE